MSIIKRQAVISEKYGAVGCNVGEDGGFAPNILRQVYLPVLFIKPYFDVFLDVATCSFPSLCKSF